MAEYTMWLDLQLFGDGAGAAAGSGAGDAGPTGATPVVGAGDDAQQAQKQRALRRNPLKDVQYGIQEGSAGGQAAADQKPEPEDRGTRWKSLRDGEYKAEFDADVQHIVQERLKGSKQREAAMQPMLKVLQQKYSVKDGDLDGLVKAVTDDDSLYEDEALQRGIPVDVLKQMKALEREHEEAEAARQQTLEEQQFRAHLQNLVQQGEVVKQTFPGFDLRTELQNNEFARLTSPQVGVDVMTAYQLVHQREIMPQAMAVGAQRTAQQISNSIQAGQRRPTENGVRKSAALDVRDDPSKLSRRDREEIKRRVRMGERIRF